MAVVQGKKNQFLFCGPILANIYIILSHALQNSPTNLPPPPQRHICVTLVTTRLCLLVLAFVYLDAIIKICVLDPEVIM